MLDLFATCFLAAMGLILMLSVIYAAVRLWPVTLILVIAWACVGCGNDAPTGQGFTYHDASPEQIAELDCALSLRPLTARLHDASGDVWLVDSLVARKAGQTVLGRTLGPDEHLSVYLVRVPAMPQIFAHELVHILEGQETGDRDADHSNPAYFGPGSLADELSQQAYAECQVKP